MPGIPSARTFWDQINIEVKTKSLSPLHICLFDFDTDPDSAIGNLAFPQAKPTSQRQERKRLTANAVLFTGKLGCGDQGIEFRIGLIEEIVLSEAIPHFVAVGFPGELLGRTYQAPWLGRQKAISIMLS